MTNEIEIESGIVYSKTDFSVIAKVCNKFGYKLQDFTKVLEQPDQLSYLFFKSIERGFQLEKKVLDYKEDKAEDLLCECYAEFMTAFNMDCLMMATTKKQRVEIEEEKKRMNIK